MFVIRKIENKYQIGHYAPFPLETLIVYEWTALGETIKIASAISFVSYLNGGACMETWPADLVLF